MAKILETDYGYTTWSFAQPVKEITDKALSQIIDPYLRDLTGKTIVPGKAINRLYYQGTGARGRAYSPDIWIKHLQRRYTRQGSPRGIVIDDMRFKNEATWARIGEFVILRVRRPEEDRISSVKDAFLKDYGRKIKKWELDMTLNQDSETEVDDVEFDHLIENDGSVDDLREKVKTLMEDL